MSAALSNGLAQDLQPNASRLHRRAIRAYETGDLSKAERLFNAVLQHDAENFDALHGLAQIHIRRGRFDTALVLMQRALREDPDRADGFATLGLAFHGVKHFAHALTSFEEGLRLAPDNAELLSRRGVALLELRRAHDALASFERALECEPDHVDALGNYANALVMLNRPQTALAAYERALSIAPENADLLTNRAVALRRLDKPQEAMLSARRALAIKPDLAQARFVESLVQLTLGDFAAGWRGYEARWGVGRLASQRRSFTAPLWLGTQPLDGKTVLLHAEQGFGDTLQFVRYAPLLKRRGARAVFVEVQRELARLLSGMPGVAGVIPRGEALPRFDMHCPLLSLPLAFATEQATIPADIPYTSPAAVDIELWRERLPRRRPLIGVAWSGDRAHDNDHNRSIGLRSLSALLAVPDVTFISLQHEVREHDRATLPNFPNLFRFEHAFRDFADTAAVIAQLDAVIAVDTAVAHLAGAMGKPLLLLLPFAADFRWLRERRDSPWYPTARLYRQPEFGDWASVVATVSQDLMRAGAVPRERKLSA